MDSWLKKGCLACSKSVSLSSPAEHHEHISEEDVPGLDSRRFSIWVEDVSQFVLRLRQLFGKLLNNLPNDRFEVSTRHHYLSITFYHRDDRISSSIRNPRHRPKKKKKTKSAAR